MHSLCWGCHLFLLSAEKAAQRLLQSQICDLLPHPQSQQLPCCWDQSWPLEHGIPLVLQDPCVGIQMQCG